MNVAGYIRVSTQAQVRGGYSLKYQEDEIKAYCEKDNLNLIHIFRAEGISGAKLNEEALEIIGWAYRRCWLTLPLSKLILWWCSTQVDYGGQIL